jgi:hypothetical protein
MGGLQRGVEGGRFVEGKEGLEIVDEDEAIREDSDAADAFQAGGDAFGWDDGGGVEVMHAFEFIDDEDDGAGAGLGEEEMVGGPEGALGAVKTVAKAEDGADFAGDIEDAEDDGGSLGERGDFGGAHNALGGGERHGAALLIEPKDEI